jgi:hypothetical protein
MALWRIPKMGAEGESRSVICESLRQKDSVKDTKKKSGMSQLFFLCFEWIMNNNSEQNLQRRRIVMEVSGPGDFPGTFFVGNAVLVSDE